MIEPSMSFVCVCVCMCVYVCVCVCVCVVCVLFCVRYNSKKQCHSARVSVDFQPSQASDQTPPLVHSSKPSPHPTINLHTLYRFHEDQLFCTNEPPVPDSRNGVEAVHYLLQPPLLRPLWYVIRHLMVGMCLLTVGEEKHMQVACLVE